jgi:hypothetical protein
MKFPGQNFSFPILKTFTIIGITTFTLLCSSLQLLAQWTDDFSDGEFLDSPQWTGDQSHFRVENQALVLDAPAVQGASYLSTSATTILETTWTFRVGLSFNPSGSNFARVYLASSHNLLSNDGDGYFVMLGSSADDICLYRQAGTTKTKIIDGPDGMLNLSASTTLIRVSCDSSGHWDLSADVNGTGMQPLGNMVDVPAFASTHFGVVCTYTATRSNGFSFDNFVIETVEDDDPPFVTQVSFVDSRKLRLVFNEALDQTTVESTNQYLIDDDIGNPVSATLSDASGVVLDFATPFVNGVKTVIHVSNVRDLAGNQMDPWETEIMFFEARPVNPKDIIFTELMPDPAPRVTLPEAEFIEILNRSSTAVNLGGWKLSDGTTNATLPDFILLPETHLILVANPHVDEFKALGSTLGLSNIPSLNNSADVLVLRDADDLVIDSVSYDLSWYRDTEKSDGGWSLELIDPQNVCAESENWEASSDPAGGTPGKINSVSASNPDLTAPRIDLVLPIADDTVRIFFNEKLSQVLPDVHQLAITPEVGIKSLRFADHSLRVLDVVLAGTIAENTRYSIHATVVDCAGNAGETTKEFAIPSSASPGDLLINEILFNPTSTGVDFIELYNASQKFIDLSSLSIAKPDDGTYHDVQKISDRSILVAPSEYVVLTTSQTIIESEYIQSRGRKMIEINIPPMPDDEGAIALLDETVSAIDEVLYSESLHDPFLEKTEGVSLERVSFSTPASDPDNWKSANGQSGYATPGYVNSNSRNRESSTAVTVVPESFQPAKGGFIQVLYSFQRNGLIGNAAVYSPEGRRIKILQQNQSLGTSGFIRWDGDAEDGSLARIGLYQICFEIYDGNGLVEIYRKRVAIAGDF